MALDNKGGPPDLDEMFRQLKNKINRFFGGSPSPQGAGPNPLWIVLGVIVALWLLSGFYIVDAREKGVITRFGAFSEVTEPGLHWHLPYPIERREIVLLTKLHNVDIDEAAEALMLTGDENIVNLRFSVQYTVNDPYAYLFNNAWSQENASDLVQQVAETSMRAIVGRKPIDFVLNEGRDMVANEAKQSIQALLNRYKSGIHIDRVNLQSIQPPEQVQAAFDDVIKAGQDKDRLKSEGQAYANDVVPKAKGIAESLKQESEAYARSVVLRAQGDARRFSQIVTEYQKAPQVTRDRMYLDAMQQVLSSSTKVIADSKSGQLLYLPLDKLISSVGNGNGDGNQALSARPAAEQTQSAAPPAPAPEYRNRERESR